MQMSVIGKGWWHGQNGQGQVARCGGVASRPWKEVDFHFHKALPVFFFLFIFSSLTCLKKLVFSNPDLLRWKVTASLSLFLKSEKIPALLYIGKGSEYRPFREFRPVPLALGTDLKSWKGLYSSPSPIQNCPVNEWGIVIVLYSYFLKPGSSNLYWVRSFMYPLIPVSSPIWVKPESESNWV
jgi:hypothetical protein